MQPFFINTGAGKLFTVYWPPVGGTLTKAILHIPAFAEEMNKSRRMVAMQAQTFANQGYAVLVPDLYGSGESEGDFSEATWPIWLQNISDSIGWLKHQGAQNVYLWGLRVGALLALDFVSRGHESIDRILAWQPVLNGDTFVTQFLRLRIAAAMMDSNAPRENTADLKQRLQEGQAIEVAGYFLNPDLIKPLMALRANALNLQSAQEIAIFEVVSCEDNPAAPANTQWLSILQEKNIDASLTKVVGDLFWASQEISEAPDLIKVSKEKVEQWL